MNQQYSSYEEMEAAHRTQDHLAGEVLKDSDATAEARANAIAEIQERVMERQLYKYNEDKQTKFRAHHVWHQFFSRHPEFNDNSANRSILSQAFDVRHGKTGKLIGSVEPDLEGLEAALAKYQSQLSRVEFEAPSVPEPEPSALERVKEYNERLRNADKEVLRDVERVRSAMTLGLVPSSPEWVARRLPRVTEQINYFLNSPQPAPTYSAPTVTAPQLTPAQVELGRRLQAAGINDVSPDRDSIRQWIHSERDEAMSQVRKFLRGRDGHIDKANEISLQSVLRGE